jgi:PAS domain S-box-containing protein
MEQLADCSVEALSRGLGYPPERMIELVTRAVETGRTVHAVIGATEGTDGRTAELALEPARDADEKVQGVVITAWDLTEVSRASRRILQLDRVYAILSGISQAIIRVRDRDALFSEACRIAAEIGGFSIAWVGMVAANGSVRNVASAGQMEKILDAVYVSVLSEPAGSGVVGTAIREDRTVIARDAVADPRLEFWREQLTAVGVGSLAAFPLHLGGRAVGAFAIYSSEPGFFDTEEVALFEEIARNISHTLDAMEAEKAREEAQRALRESERRYRDVFEMNPQPMFVYDRETLRFLAVNSVALETYGYSREDYESMTILDIRPAEEIDRQREILDVPASELKANAVSRHRRKNGTCMDVEVVARDLEFDGRPARIIAATDVSEMRRLEKQLAEATRMESMGRLAGGIAHDFNNLLTAIIGYADLLEVELGDSPEAREAREIRRAGLRATDLTRQVLAFAKRVPMDPRPVDLNVVVTGVSTMLRRLIGGEVRLITRLTGERAVVMADPGQLEQVLVNLALNARDAMPGGGAVEIAVAVVERVETLERGLDGPAVALTVTDTGRGMDEYTLAHAFEPFFTTKHSGEGTGLGLATAYGIVAQFGGRIWADSAPGCGTQMHVLLPRVDAEPEAADAPVPVAAAEPGSLATILVVDDEPAVRAFVVSTLEHAGYRVLVAGSPAEAMALTVGLDEPIELLLTDMVMPDSSGETLAAQLTSLRPGLRVVLMSGYSEGLVARPLPSNQPFLAKPFSRERLIGVIAEALAEG